MFCRNCGKEVSENAFVCPNCGCLVNEKENDNKQLVRQTTAESVEKRRSLLLKVFLYASFALSCVAVILCALSVAMGYVYFYDEVSTLYSSSYVSGYESFEIEYVWAIIGWIAGILSMSAGITAFVIGLKETENAYRMISALNFILSISVCLGTFLFWFVNLL